MVAGSGAVEPARRLRCGDRSVEGVRHTFRRCCKGKHKQTVSNKGGRSWSESSSSGECEDKVLARQAQWATQTEVCELRDEVKKVRGRKQWAQGERASAEGKSEEKEKMEVDEEVDSKKKLDQRKSWFYNCQKSMSAQICRKLWRTRSKKSVSRSCKIASLDGMISCQRINRCRRDRKSCRVCRIEEAVPKQKWSKYG